MQTRYSDEKDVCPSVCPSVKRVNCDKTVERSAPIFTPYEISFSLVFWEEEWLVGATPSTWNFGSTGPRWSENMRNHDMTKKWRISAANSSVAGGFPNIRDRDWRTVPHCAQLYTISEISRSSSDCWRSITMSHMWWQTTSASSSFSRLSWWCHSLTDSLQIPVILPPEMSTDLFSVIRPDPPNFRSDPPITSKLLIRPDPTNTRSWIVKIQYYHPHVFLIYIQQYEVM